MDTENSAVLLIHGGLREDCMDADRFWTARGISGGLERDDFTVLAASSRAA